MMIYDDEPKERRICPNCNGDGTVTIGKTKDGKPINVTCRTCGGDGYIR